MHEEKDTNNYSKSQRVALTARLSFQAYDAITELQRQYRRRTGRHLPLWKVLDAAIVAYARQKGIQVRE
ncbi:MAG: hypothetical protein KAI94_14210 [Anaerolineales bacterium]|nr:hypothetical protein [Anaerolineales bacterium]